MKKNDNNSTELPSIMRNRSVVIGAGVLTMLVTMFAVWYFLTTVSSAASRSNVLPVKSITFSGDMKRVDAAGLKSIAGGIQNVGGSMLNTDLSQVKAVVKQVEWVRDAVVRRRFPSTLEIQIEEHQPVARWLVADSDSAFLVNSFGEVFEADSDDALPGLSGPTGSSAEVLAMFADTGKQLAAVGQTLSALRLSARRAWQLKLDNGTTIELGRNNAQTRLARYLSATRFVPALQLAGGRIDMRYDSGLAVRTTVKSVVAKPAPEPAKKPKVKAKT